MIFLVNIPIGLVAVVVASRMLRESRHPNRPTVDLVGVGLASLGLFLLIYPLVEGREAGWPAWAFAMLLATLPVLVGFVLYERRVVRRGKSPLVALHLFRVPTVALGLVVSVVFFSGLGVFFVVLTVFFQEGFGYSAFSAGLMFLPFALSFSTAAAVSGPIAARIGAWIVNLGTFLMMLGLLGIIALVRLAPVNPVAVALDWRMLVPLFLLYGLGQGLAQPALINTVVGSSGVSGEDAGAAAGLFLTTAQSAIALGVAAIGDVFFTRLGPQPNAATYCEALAGALSCNLALQVAAFLLVLRLRRVGGSAPPQRRLACVAPTDFAAADKGE